MQDPDYIIDYEVFMNNFRKTEVSGEEIGEVIGKLAGYFARYNVRTCEALRRFMVVKAELQNQIDTSTGKPMSAAKADTLAAATIEANLYEEAKVHIENIQQYINALKSLQKGVLFEYSNS